MDVFTALADPTRRQLLERLRAGEQPAMQLVRQFPHLSRPAVLKHLGVLLETGLVTQRSQGRERLYRLNPEGLRPADLWLAQYRTFWVDALDRLEAQLTQETSPPEETP